jgi:xanthosine utilization system XapX-like protein
MISHSIGTNAIAVGIVLGIVFAFVQVSAPESLSNIVLAAAYAAVLVLVTAAFLPSMKWGLLSGLVVIICEPMGELVYYSLTYGLYIAGGMVLSVLFLPRFVVLPLSGIVGGAVGVQLSPKRKRKRGKRERKRRA